jgi:hypothetical protein
LAGDQTDAFQQLHWTWVEAFAGSALLARRVAIAAFHAADRHIVAIAEGIPAGWGGEGELAERMALGQRWQGGIFDYTAVAISSEASPQTDEACFSLFAILGVYLLLFRWPWLVEKR